MKLSKCNIKVANNVKCFSTSQNYLANRVVDVGSIEAPKLTSNYETGQLFIHRVFGYRGAVLFPWTAKVYDKDAPPNSKSDESNENSPEAPSEPNEANTSHNQEMRSLFKQELKGSGHTYYQVLIDSKDCHDLKLSGRTQPEAVTFLGNQEHGRLLYAVPGLDYVAHEDVMPFAPTEANVAPMHHELFQKFLKLEKSREGSLHYTGRDTLKMWQARNHPWLELSEVYKEVTENVRVTVIPFYMGCREANTNQTASGYWWRYCVRLENTGDMSVQLKERHWRIFSLSGSLETVRGRGVVGLEPALSKTDPAFQYSSHVSLQSPSGHMWGTFRMVREDGYVFECRIPPFSLESKQTTESSPL